MMIGRGVLAGVGLYSLGGTGSLGLGDLQLSGNVPDGQVGVPYQGRIDMSGIAPFAVSMPSGNYPPGISGPSLPPSSIALQGIPTAAGTFTFTLKATDVTGIAGQQSFSITIHPAGGAPAHTNTTQQQQTAQEQVMPATSSPFDFLTQATIIGTIPNWMVFAGAAAALFILLPMLTGKHR